MEIYITYRVKADSEEMALQKGKPQIKQAIISVESILDKMESQFMEIYPSYPIQVDYLDTEAEIWDDIESVWNVFTTMHLVLKNKFDESGEYNEYDIWESIGCPTYKNIQEPLFYLDWNELKETCNTKVLDLGLFFDIQFDSIQAVDSYSGQGFHFYNNTEWL